MAEAEVRSDIVEVAKVDLPCTDKVPVLVVEASMALLAFKVEVALILPAIKLDPVALSKNKEEMYSDVARSIEAKKLVDVPFTLLSSVIVPVDADSTLAVRLVEVVVAKVVVPSTIDLPVVVELPK